MNVLVEQDVRDVEVWTAGEVDGLFHPRADPAMRRPDEAFHFEGARRGYGYIASDVIAIDCDVPRDLGSGCADGVPGHRAGNLRALMVLKDQQRGRGGKVLIGVEDVQRAFMRAPVAEHRREGSEVYAVRREVQRRHARYRAPQQRIDASGVNPWINRSGPGGLSVDGHFGFAEGS